MPGSEQTHARSYVLDGIADLPQRRMIERARSVVADDDRILAAWLVGSFATGEADLYSDVDLHCLITDESVEEFRTTWPETAAEIAGPLAFADNLGSLIGGLVLTTDWWHLDLILHPRSEFDPHDVRGLRPLYDATGDLLPADVVPRAPNDGPPHFPVKVVTLFLYFLGNLTVTFGRDELLVAHGGLTALRDLLIELMLAERGVRRVGGNKRLNPFLSDEQRTFLETIPAAATTPADITATARVISREFIRRGKLLAERTGATWPTALEDAAIAHLRRHLAIDFRT